MKTISIVIPFHDEEKNLEILLPDLRKYVNDNHQILEVLLVNDLSKDSSKLVVEKFAQNNIKFKLLDLKFRGGQTGAFQKAFEISDGDYIIRMDADLQDDPSNLPKFIKKINEGYDIVMGIRKNRSHPLILILLSKSYDIIFSILFQSKVKSNSGSFIAFRSKFVKNIKFKKNDHRYLPLISYHRGAKNIFSLDINHKSRKFGSTKYKIYKKVLFGCFEAFLFYVRLKKGYYD
tara:strand:- start:684 stop:1382 length:699 start_codon:yes stop_codon:yes gene_type:complete